MNKTHPIIRLENICFEYRSQDSVASILKGINLEVLRGEYLVIAGRNGSGKSTLAKHLNALLQPTEGDVWVKDWNTRKPNHWRDIRSTVGMVFQNPDNQIVAPVVEEDVAFGPENLELPRCEILRRIEWSLAKVGMLSLRNREPHKLSGGQKQRLCIAGVLAMKPEVLVLDEATAMLDPAGRTEVLKTVYALNKKERITIVAITHYMEEAIAADRVIILSDGKIALHGTPREIFHQSSRLRELNIAAPQITQLAATLNEKSGIFSEIPLTVEEFVVAVGQKIHGRRAKTSPIQCHQEIQEAVQGATVSQSQVSSRTHYENTAGSTAASRSPSSAPPVIELKDVTYQYPLYDEYLRAVDGVSFKVHQGEILGIIGQTGSGKSTIIQLLNGLLRPQKGFVKVFDQDINTPKVDLQNIRRRVGLVFQSPEAQLFEKYVGDDIAFGPRNLKLSKDEIRDRVKQAMEFVGLSFEEFKDRLTWSLSGGEMRRAALAGTLALRPEVLVLDEPTGGLDPRSRTQLLDNILRVRRESGITLVLVSHNMEEMAGICDRICVLRSGKIVMIDTPFVIFARPQPLRELGLNVPPVTEAMYQLQCQGLIAQTGPVLTIGEALERLDSKLS